MRGFCTSFWLRTAVLWPALLQLELGCDTKDPAAAGLPNSATAGEALPPGTAGASGHSGSQAGQTAAIGGTHATGLGGAGASVATPAGTGGPTMTPAAPGGMGGSGTAGTAAASGAVGAAGSGMEPNMVPTTPELFPTLEAAQIGVPMRLVANHELAEGPLWDHCRKKLLFTDVEHKAIHTIEPDGTIGMFRMDTNFTNGLAFDMSGRLVQAEMGGRDGGRVTRIEKDGTLTVLADKTPRGAQLNTTDDLIVRSDGTIYFSDPIIPHGPSATVSITGKPLYRIPAGMPGTVILEDTLSLPNGVDLSPDEKVLYVAEFLGGAVARFDVAADGSLSGRKTFLGGLTNPDSMCVDAAGNVYIGVSQGLVIARPDGMRVKTVSMQTNNGVTNCEFGGEDGKTLYITAWASVWKIENMPIPGLVWTVNKRVACEP
jgi:gluconolactonase